MMSPGRSYPWGKTRASEGKEYLRRTGEEAPPTVSNPGRRRAWVPALTLEGVVLHWQRHPQPAVLEVAEPSGPVGRASAGRTMTRTPWSPPRRVERAPRRIVSFKHAIVPQRGPPAKGGVSSFAGSTGSSPTGFPQWSPPREGEARSLNV
jgi:hypothetical protein